MSTTKHTTFRTVTNFNPKQPRGGDGRWVPKGSKGDRKKYKDTVFAPQEFEEYAKDQVKPNKKMKFIYERYQNTDAYIINEALKRSKGKISDPKKLAYEVDDNPLRQIELGKQRQQEIIDMDNNMVHRIEGDTYLYRGISHFDTAYFEKGDIIPHYGYASTSFKKEVAVKHTSNAMKRGGDDTREIVLKIRAPRGTKGFVPSKVTDSRYGEQEFLLPRGGNFVVENIISTGERMDSGRMYEPDFEYDFLEVTYVPAK